MASVPGTNAPDVTDEYDRVTSGGDYIGARRR